jgi:hypothetical protein
MHKRNVSIEGAAQRRLLVIGDLWDGMEEHKKRIILVWDDPWVFYTVELHVVDDLITKFGAFK